MAQTAARALDLLDAVVRAPRPRGLMEIAEQTGIDKSTASRLLGLLVERGFVSRDEDSRRYGVGPAMFGLAAAVSARMDIRTVASAHLAALRAAARETVSLHLRAGRRRVCVDGAESDQPVRRVVPVGESLPLYLGPSGKIMLAYLEPRERALVLADARAAGADVAAIRHQISEFAAAGYAITAGDRTPGVRAISAPIFGARGVIASITVAGPSDRFSDDGAHHCLPALLDAARATSAAVGGRTPDSPELP